VASAATPAVSGENLTLTAVSVVDQPSWNKHDNDDNDKWKKNNNWNKGKNHWNNGWNKRWWSVSPWQCRKGHGWVDWKRDRCWGGWYSGARIRRW
jgi:hypothetical protein